MKNILKAALLALVLVPLAARAQTQIQWYVSLDEYGNGKAFDGINTLGLNSQLIADPSGGIAGPVLVYTLPFNFSPNFVGDYLLQEPPGYNEVSDVIRFWAPAGTVGNQVIFYSDLPDPDEPPPIPLADTGLPTAYLQNFVVLRESGIEGGYQAAVHSPITGEPGYILDGSVTYTFISDVPEPGSFAIAGMGLAALFGLRRLLRQK